MKIAVYNIQGEATGREIELPDNVFGIEPNEHAVYLAVKQYRANQRQGTHKSKERNEIVGSTKKIKRQKGTGTARAGSIKSPVFRGGGRVFGPKPRTYSSKLNKKVKALARKSALTDKLAKDKGIIVVENFNIETPKTKQYLDILSNLELDDRKTLLVTSENDTNIYMSSRNVPYSSTMAAKDLNTYAILNANCLILTEASVDKIKELFA
jgi:large subunit ribosomal protein L4